MRSSSQGAGQEIQLRQRVVELIGSLSDVLVDAAVALKVGDVLAELLTALVERRDDIGTGLAEELERDRDFVRAVGVALELVGELGHDNVRALQIARGVANADAEQLERLGLLLVAGRSLGDRPVQLPGRVRHAVEIAAGLLCGEAETADRFDGDARLLRKIVQVIGSVDAALNEPLQRRDAETGAQCPERALEHAERLVHLPGRFARLLRDLVERVLELRERALTSMKKLGTPASFSNWPKNEAGSGSAGAFASRLKSSRKSLSGGGAPSFSGLAREVATVRDTSAACRSARRSPHGSCR
jgi:hypothetical protein